MYYNVEPFGEQRADLRTAVLICYLVNHLHPPKQTLQPKDILPFLGDAPEPTRTTGIERGIELEKKMSVYTMLHNASVAAQAAKAGGKQPYVPAPGGRLS